MQPDGTGTSRLSDVGVNATSNPPLPDESQTDRTSGGFSTARTIAYSAGNVGAGTMFGFANAALPLYLAGYGFPNWAIGLLAQDRPPLGGLSQIVVGWLSDRTRTRLGRRRPYILGGVPLAVASLVVLALHPPVWLMIPVLTLMTTALAVAYGPYLTLLRDLVPERQRGRVGAALALGNMIGQLAILLLAAQYWERQNSVVFVAVAGALFLGFGLAFFGVGEPPVGPLEPRSEPARRTNPRDYLRGILRHREASKYLLPTLLFWLGTGSIMPFLTRFAVDELGTDDATAFRLLIVAIGATAIFTIPAGWLGDHLGKKPVLLVGLLALGGVVLVGSQVRTVEQAIVALALTGVANSVCTVLLLPLLADLIPDERAGEFTGLANASWELAQPLGAVVGGVAADMTGTLRTTLVAAGLILLVAGALLVPVQPGQAHRGDQAG